MNIIYGLKFEHCLLIATYIDVLKFQMDDDYYDEHWIVHDFLFLLDVPYVVQIFDFDELMHCNTAADCHWLLTMTISTRAFTLDKYIHI